MGTAAYIEDPTDGWKRLRCPDKRKCVAIKTGQLRTDGWVWGYLAVVGLVGLLVIQGQRLVQR